MTKRHSIRQFRSWKEVVAVLTYIEFPCTMMPAFTIHGQEVVESMSELKSSFMLALDRSPTGEVHIKLSADHDACLKLRL